MKNVLLATTALVAMAGAASAEVTMTGDATAEYNSLAGFSYDVGLDFGATAELNNGVTAGMSWGASLTNSTSYITGDNYPVVWIESSMGKFTAGQANNVGEASDHYSATSGVSDFGSYSANRVAVRADLSVAGFDMSASEIVTGASDLRVGVSGKAGSVDFGLGYANATGAFGLNAGTTFGAFSVDASYFSGDSTYGVEVGYDMGNGIDMSAAYASTGAWNIGLGYASGAITADLGYDSTGAATIDGTYAISSDWKAYAGYDSGSTIAYLGTTYDLGGGAEVYAAYSTGANGTTAGPDDWNGGITVGASMTF